VKKNKTQIRAKIREVMYASEDVGYKLLEAKSSEEYLSVLRRSIDLERELLELLESDEQ
jgi:hypothetical protein